MKRLVGWHVRARPTRDAHESAQRQLEMFLRRGHIYKITKTIDLRSTDADEL